MSGYPRKAHLFKAWTEAMLRNATVDTPDYGKKAGTSGRKSTGSKTSRTRRRRRKKKKDA